jgi:hypothetical protein
VAGGLALVLLSDGGVLGVVLLAATSLLGFILFVTAVMRWRRDEQRYDAPAREPHLLEADIAEDTRKRRSGPSASATDYCPPESSQN